MKTLAELKELGMVGTASMGRGFSDRAVEGNDVGIPDGSACQRPQVPGADVFRGVWVDGRHAA